MPQEYTMSVKALSSAYKCVLPWAFSENLLHEIGLLAITRMNSSDTDSVPLDRAHQNLVCTRCLRMLLSERNGIRCDKENSPFSKNRALRNEILKPTKEGTISHSVPPTAIFNDPSGLTSRGKKERESRKNERVKPKTNRLIEVLEFDHEPVLTDIHPSSVDLYVCRSFHPVFLFCWKFHLWKQVWKD